MTTIPEGGSYRDNRRELAQAMVSVSGSHGHKLVIKSPMNVRLVRQSIAVIDVDGDANLARDAMVDVIYDLLTAVADDVQERFAVHRGVQDPPKDPDEIVGTNLIRVFHSKKTSESQQTSSRSGRD